MFNMFFLSVSRTQTVTLPKPITKLGVTQKTTAKSKQMAQLQMQPSTSNDDELTINLKRKREDDDYDAM